MQNSNFKFSIITVSYNSSSYIEETIKSVQKQNYKNIEHIFIDGSSTDGTLEIINKYKRETDILVSESDNGIYDAMNKGIRMASGDIICFINSDDFYIDSDAISNIAGVFLENSVDCVFANINYVKADDPSNVVRKWVSGEFIFNSFKKGWHPAHPAFFVKKGIYDEYGLFNTNFILAADFEIMLRFLECKKISNCYLNKAIINMRLGGATNGSFRNIINQNLECLRAFKVNNLDVSAFYPVYRILPKIIQYFK